MGGLALLSIHGRTCYESQKYLHIRLPQAIGTTFLTFNAMSQVTKLL